MTTYITNKQYSAAKSRLTRAKNSGDAQFAEWTTTILLIRIHGTLGTWLGRMLFSQSNAVMRSGIELNLMRLPLR